MTRTTKADFAYFKKCCKHWIDFFGLKEFHVHFSHEENGGESYATLLNSGVSASTITINFELEIAPPSPKKDLDRHAFHEVCHLLLARYARHAENRYATKEDMFMEEESVIRRLENCIYQKLK